MLLCNLKILNLKKNLLSIAVCMALMGCVSSVESLRRANFNGSSFQIELSRLYLDFAESEADQYDWFNSSYFAKKGLKVIGGENPPPESLESWSMPDDVMPTLVQAREYLISVLTPKAIGKFPEQAARAQFMFDCWVEQQEENWQQKHIEYCREGFYSALDNLFAMTAAADAPPVRPKNMPIIKPALPIKNKFIYFKTGSSNLDNSSKRIVSNIVSRLKDVRNYDITLNGYADMVGGEDFNMKLSKKRALAIKKALVDGGLNSKSIMVFAFGNSSGRVKAKRGVAEKENRVVEIVLDIKN